MSTASVFTLESLNLEKDLFIYSLPIPYFLILVIVC